MCIGIYRNEHIKISKVKIKNNTMKIESRDAIYYIAMLMSSMIILCSLNIFNFYMGWCWSSGSG